MSTIGKYHGLEIDLLSKHAQAFDRSRMGKRQVNYLYNGSFSRMLSNDNLLYLASGITHLTRVLQLQREELPFNSTYPQIKYRWSFIYEVSFPGIHSLHLGIVSYPRTKEELSAKEREKQHLLPRKKVVTFFGTAGWFPIDCGGPNNKLFSHLIDALERSREDKKSDINYGIHGYRKPLYPFIYNSPLTLLKVVKRQFSHREPMSSCDHSVKKQWIVVYKSEDQIGECVLSTVWYPYGYSPTGQEAVGEKTVLAFPVDRQRCPQKAMSSAASEPPKVKKSRRRRLPKSNAISRVNPRFKLIDSNFPPLSK